MISFDEARAAVLANADRLATCRVGLAQARGYVLAEPIDTPHDLPTFDNSAVDGFGVHAADVAGAGVESPTTLPLCRTIRAGDDVADFVLQAGQTAKILTGAPVPPGVDAVIMREQCREEHATIHIEKPAKPGQNIRRRGEEFAEGQQVLDAGLRITPPVVGLLATLGLTKVAVFCKPRVVVVVTGDELVQPGHPLKPGKIYESNSFALRSILSEMGVEQVETLQLADDRAALTAGLGRALQGADLLITVGGVSVGDYDFVKDVLADLDVEQVYWQINMKPGKPNYLGVYRNEQGVKTLVFGLPGNPVSVQVSFHQLVKPAILKMMGVQQLDRRLLPADLLADIRRKAGRREFLRGVLSTQDGRSTVRPVAGQGSHMQGGLAQANCLIDVPSDRAGLSKGDQVFVERLAWH